MEEYRLLVMMDKKKNISKTKNKYSKTSRKKGMRKEMNNNQGNRSEM